jgi:hypothetical protein
MDPLWVGKALLLSLIGVILGMILRVIMGLLPTETRKVLQLYLVVIGIWAAIGFGSVFPLFSYLSINDGYSAEIAGTILIACFIGLCVGVTALFYDKTS